MEYSYGFSPELEQEWEWTEVFPAQEELERYFNHVADRFDLRRDIQLGTRVTAATYDDAERAVARRHRPRRPLLGAVPRDGDRLPLGAARARRSRAASRSRGSSLYTNAWPQDPPDLTGKRVGLVGTGSSGVQATPELARDAAELYVFQRTPSYAWPAGNKPLDPELQRDGQGRSTASCAPSSAANYGGVVGTSGAVAVPLPRDVAILEATPEERLGRGRRAGWAACRAWSDVLRDLEANEAGRRALPGDGPAGDRRPRDRRRPVAARPADRVQAADPAHRLLRDVQPRPRAPRRPAPGGIEEITPDGIRTAQGDYELDVIVFATGFDAMTGALIRIDIRGRDGVPLARRVGRRRPHAARHPDRRVPELLHHHRAREPVGARQHGRVRRAARRVDRRPAHATCASTGYTRGRAHARGAGRVGRAGEPGRGRHDVHRAHLQLVVPRRQHPRARCACSCPRSAGCPAYIEHCDRIVGRRATRGSRSRESAVTTGPTVDFDLFGPVTRAESDASWVEPREQCPVAWTERHGGFWVDQRLRRGRRRVPRLGALLVGAHRSRGQLDRARRSSRLPLLTPEEIDPPDWYPVRRILSELLAPARRRAAAAARPALDDALRRPVHRGG